MTSIHLFCQRRLATVVLIVVAMMYMFAGGAFAQGSDPSQSDVRIVDLRVSQRMVHPGGWVTVEADIINAGGSIARDIQLIPVFSGGIPGEISWQANRDLPDSRLRELLPDELATLRVQIKTSASGVFKIGAALQVGSMLSVPHAKRVRVGTIADLSREIVVSGLALTVIFLLLLLVLKRLKLSLCVDWFRWIIASLLVVAALLVWSRPQLSGNQWSILFGMILILGAFYSLLKNRSNLKSYVAGGLLVYFLFGGAWNWTHTVVLDAQPYRTTMNREILTETWSWPFMLSQAIGIVAIQEQASRAVQ